MSDPKTLRARSGGAGVGKCNDGKPGISTAKWIGEEAMCSRGDETVEEGKRVGGKVGEGAERVEPRGREAGSIVARSKYRQ